MDNRNANHRLAINSLLLYGRMLIVLIISLYTSRIVLKELGVDDYGLFVIVGGIVSLLGFLNSCVTSTQRFLNYEMGKKNSSIENLRLIFSNALSIHAIIILVVLILAETIGLWYVNYKLVIPPHSLLKANIIFQVSLIIFCLNMIQMPYSADVIAHERMDIYASIGIFDIVLKLIAALLLYLLSTNKLITYSYFLLSAQIIVLSTYIIICRKKFSECRFRFRYSSALFRQLFSFTGWNTFGSLAWLARAQGIGVILNLFFGVALNAAKGISDQVANAVNTLSNNFQIALNPQITKQYALGEHDRMEVLAFRGVKFSSLLLWLMGLPILLNIDYILNIWLDNVPKYASIFISLSIIDILVSNLFGSPLMSSLAATGRIKKYQVTVSLILLLVLPSSYIAFKLGASPKWIYILNIIFSLCGGVVRLYFCKVQIGYSIRLYFKHVFVPVIGVVIISSIIPTIFKYILILDIADFIRFVMSVIFSVVCVAATTLFVALTAKERKHLILLIWNKVKRGNEG